MHNYKINLFNPWQTVAEREADNKRLQEQLTEARQANETIQANQSQSSQSIQSSDVNAAGEVTQSLQDELTKLRQEVSCSKLCPG